MADREAWLQQNNLDPEEPLGADENFRPGARDTLVTTDLATGEETRQEITRPHTVDSVMDEWEDRARRDQESERAEAEAKVESRKAEVSKIREWSAEDNDQLAQLAGRTQALAQVEEMLARTRAAAPTMLAELKLTDPARAAAVEAEYSRWDAWAKTERAYLDQAAVKVRDTAEAKARAAEREAFLDRAPELRDADKRAEFISWASERFNITPDEAKSVRDPRVVMSALKEYRQHQRDQRVAAVANEIWPDGVPTFMSRAKGGTPRTVEQAQQRLKETGNLKDAYALLQMRRAASRGA